MKKIKMIRVIDERGQVITAKGSRAERLWEALKARCIYDHVNKRGQIEMQILDRLGRFLFRTVEVVV